MVEKRVEGFYDFYEGLSPNPVDFGNTRPTVRILDKNLQKEVGE